MDNVLDRPCANHLLAALPDDLYARLSPLLTDVQLDAGQCIHDVGDDVLHTVFPCDHTLVALEIAARAAGRVEVALIGVEGAVGGVISHGHVPAFSRAEVLLGGPAVSISSDDLQAALHGDPSLRRWLARYGDCLFAQVLQAAACNAVHSIEQRAAKWLVAAVRRTGSATLPFTQDRLAQMLGVGRSFVNRVLQRFKAEGLIESRRGVLVVRDGEGLGAYACPCDALVKAHCDDVMGRPVRSAHA